MTDKEKFISVLDNQEYSDASYEPYKVETRENQLIVRIDETGWVFDKTTERFQYMYNYKE